MRLVSVVIPVYNSEQYITSTLGSILEQDYHPIEIIVVNDGSTDRSMELCSALNSALITIVNKDNSGVSDARNLGLQHAKGDFVVFFDSDDLMSPGFISQRVLLMNDPAVGFSCGKIIKKYDNGNTDPQTFLPACKNIPSEILLYSTNIVTCPSNYLIRKQVIQDHNLQFNPKLSSSADRYYLMELNRHTRGAMVENGGELIYLVRGASMSNKISSELINDNHLYKKMVISNFNIPNPIRNEFLFRINYILSGANMKNRHYLKSFQFAIKSFFLSPLKFIKQMFS